FPYTTLFRSLGAGVAALFGGTTGRVTLHDVNFGFFWVFRRAVRQFTGHTKGFQRRLPAGLFASFARGHASLCCQLGFANNISRRGRVALQPVTELLGHGRVDVAASLGVAEFGFGLTFKLWFGQFHRDDGGEAFTNVITGEVFVFVTQDLLFAGVPVDQRGQRTTEAFFVGATLVRINGVRIRVH